MTNEQKLSKAFEDVIWMAMRYAHGRHTYAPSMVREAITLYKQVNPEWKPRQDITIKFEPDTSGVGLRSDWLDDLLPNVRGEVSLLAFGTKACSAGDVPKVPQGQGLTPPPC